LEEDLPNTDITAGRIMEPTPTINPEIANEEN